jgi:hypothetical protein
MRGTKQLGGSNRDGERTIGDACAEVIPEVLVERIVEQLFFGGGHKKNKEVRRGRRRLINGGGAEGI